MLRVVEEGGRIKLASDDPEQERKYQENKEILNKIIYLILKYRKKKSRQRKGGAENEAENEKK